MATKTELFLARRFRSLGMGMGIAFLTLQHPDYATAFFVIAILATIDLWRWEGR